MIRLSWFIGGVLLFSLVSVAFLIWFFKDYDPFATPFSTSTRLSSGEMVTVAGTDSSGFDGDTSTKYTITLHFPKGQREQVSQGELFNQRPPSGPFTLARTATHLFLASDREIYYRPLPISVWQTWNYESDATLRFVGRALMPTKYAHNEQFESNWPAQSHHDRLPDVPSYVFERWVLPSRLIVMRQNDSDPLWPKRLVFRNWRVDVPRTLALEPKFRLRPLPQGIHVDLLIMSFASDATWDEHIISGQNYEAGYHYENIRKIPGARVLGSEQWTLSPQSHTTPLDSWWSVRGKTTLQMRGLCADPNSNLVHFAWKIGNQPQHWTIAHNNEWMPVREDDGSGLVKPYLFARFSWPIRQTKLRHDLPRSRRHYSSASRRSRRHDAVFRRAVR